MDCWVEKLLICNKNWLFGCFACDRFTQPSHIKFPVPAILKLIFIKKYNIIYIENDKGEFTYV